MKFSKRKTGWTLLLDIVVICAFVMAVLICSCDGQKKVAHKRNADVRAINENDEKVNRDMPFLAFDSPEQQMNALIAVRQMINRRQCNRAIRVCEALLKSGPGGQTEAQAWNYLAICHFQTGDRKEGKRVFELIRERYAEDAENLRAMVMHEANIYWKNDLHAEATLVLNELLKMSECQQKPGVFLQMALVEKDRGNLEKCRKIAEKILVTPEEKSAVSNDARILIANSYLDERNVSAALKAVNRASKTGADINQLSLIYLRIAKEKEKTEYTRDVETFYLMLLDRFKGYSDQLNNLRAALVSHYLKAGGKEQALRLLTTIVKESTNDKQKEWAQINLDELKQNGEVGKP